MEFWFKSYSRLYLESGVKIHQSFRKEMGLNNPYNVVKIRGEFQLQSLASIFGPDEVNASLHGRLTPDEVNRLVYGATASEEDQGPQAQALSAITNGALHE